MEVAAEADVVLASTVAIIFIIIVVAAPDVVVTPCLADAVAHTLNGVLFIWLPSVVLPLSGVLPLLLLLSLLLLLLQLSSLATDALKQKSFFLLLTNDINFFHLNCRSPHHPHLRRHHHH